MDATNMNVSDDFDPYTQTISIIISPGDIGQLTLEDIDFWQISAVKACINYASQFGASAMLFFLMLVLTKGDKRRSPIFVTNCIGLVFNAIKNLLQCRYYTSHWWQFYAYFLQDASQVTKGEVINSVAVVVFSFIVYICIITSLNLQINIMLNAATTPWQKIAILSSSLLLSFMTISFRFSLMVVNIKYIIAKQNQSEWQWLPQACIILLTVTICYASLIFCAKLFFAIRQRRSIGMKDFGPIQILFVVSSQTLVLPVIILIIQLTTDIPEFHTLSLTVTLISLPLSAMWAATNVGERNTAKKVEAPSFVKNWKNSWTDRSSFNTNSTLSKNDVSPRILEEARTINERLDKEIVI